MTDPQPREGQRTEPATEAGRRLLHRKHRPVPTSVVGIAERRADAEDILAIEREARATALRGEPGTPDHVARVAERFGITEADARDYIEASNDPVGTDRDPVYRALAAAPPEPGLDVIDAVDRALLFVLQLSDKQHRAVVTALGPQRFIRALEQDGFTVAARRAAPHGPDAGEREP